MQSRETQRSDVDLANAKLQRKVTRIIFTDFCCWIPICIMAFMSAAGKSTFFMMYKYHPISIILYF